VSADFDQFLDMHKKKSWQEVVHQQL
jgi:hypothetical protein